MPSYFPTSLLYFLNLLKHRIPHPFHTIFLQKKKKKERKKECAQILFLHFTKSCLCLISSCSVLIPCVRSTVGSKVQIDLKDCWPIIYLVFTPLTLTRILHPFSWVHSQVLYYCNAFGRPIFTTIHFYPILFLVEEYSIFITAKKFNICCLLAFTKQLILWQTNTLHMSKKCYKSSKIHGNQTCSRNLKYFLRTCGRVRNRAGQIFLYPWENFRVLPQYFMGNRTDFRFLNFISGIS